MPESQAPKPRTARRVLIWAIAGGALSGLCGCPVSIGIALALDLAGATWPLSEPALGIVAWGGLILFGLAAGAGLGYLSRDIHWEDLQ